ncbi:MAG: glycosyltransferase, partial [Bryobacteraceae bacterium]
FAVSCQIFFSASGKKREETGLTQAAWHEGRLHVRHRIDPSITGLYPCFYGGGGSCAFDRLKFLELGGFDPLLAPFYLEDTDLGFLAWKRGWKVLYQPRSVVHHEHRGTIGRHFSRQHIEAAYNKNFALFSWKNIHEWRRLAAHFAFAFSEAIASALLGNAPARTNALVLWRAFRQLPQALGSRWRARGLALAEVNDTEAFVRHLGGYYRDRFDDLERLPPSEPVRVLFVSPYPICPPVHGGAVFMHGTVAELTRLCELHLIVLLERPEETAAHRNLAQLCASAEFLVRAGGPPKSFGSIVPHAVDESRDEDLAWTIHRQIYTRKTDVIQLEYTALAQYAGGYRRVVNALF